MDSQTMQEDGEDGGRPVRDKIQPTGIGPSMYPMSRVQIGRSLKNVKKVTY